MSKGEFYNGPDPIKREAYKGACGCAFIPESKKIFLCHLHAAGPQLLELVKHLVKTSPDEEAKDLAEKTIAIIEAKP